MLPRVMSQGLCACISGIWFEVINDVTKIGFLFPTATVWLGGSALTDILIAVTMIVLVSSLLNYINMTLTHVSKLFASGSFVNRALGSQVQSRLFVVSSG